MFIYKIINLVNNKVYIGKTMKSIDIRFKEHIYESRRGCKFAIHNAIRKHGIDNFKIVKLCKCDNPKQLSNLEIFWIKYFKSNNSKHGYNLTSGGEGTPGHSVSIETRLKFSQLHKGKTISESQKEIIREGHRLGKYKYGKGTTKSEEFKKANSEWMKNNMTQEMKDKLAEGRKKFYSNPENIRRKSEKMKKNNPMKNPVFAKRHWQSRYKNKLLNS